MEPSISVQRGGTPIAHDGAADRLHQNLADIVAQCANGIRIGGTPTCAGVVAGGKRQLDANLYPGEWDAIPSNAARHFRHTVPIRYDGVPSARAAFAEAFPEESEQCRWYQRSSDGHQTQPRPPQPSDRRERGRTQRLGRCIFHMVRNCAGELGFIAGELGVHP